MKTKTELLLLTLLTITLGFAAHLEAQGQGSRYVTLYEGEKQTGVSKKYPVGNWYLGGAEAFDNRTSSITVDDGLSVAVCDNSQNPAFITGGKTPVGCVRFPEGKYEFHGFNKKATYIVVEQFEDHRRDCVVCLYSGIIGRGYVRRFKETGTFPVAEYIGYREDLDGNPAPLLGNTASSLWVAPGYSVTVESLGIPKNFSSGIHNLPPDFNNHISEIIIKKDSAAYDSSKKDLIRIRSRQSRFKPR